MDIKQAIALPEWAPSGGNGVLEKPKRDQQR